MQDNLQTLAHSDESYGDGVPVYAGFSNPTLDRRRAGVQLSLDLNRHLIKNPSSSFMFRIAGHIWADQGIYDGDIAIVDRVLAAQATDLVIIWQASGFSLSRKRQLSHEDEPLGVVTAIIHQLRP